MPSLRSVGLEKRFDQRIIESSGNSLRGASKDYSRFSIAFSTTYLSPKSIYLEKSRKPCQRPPSVLPSPLGTFRRVS